MKTVEDKFKRAMEHVQISAALILQGTDIAPVEERLDWMASHLEDARRWHRASVKKAEKKARAEKAAVRFAAEECMRRSGR